MAYDKVVDSAVLDAGLTKIADAIRAKGGTTDNMEFPDGFASLIESIETGGGVDVTPFSFISVGSYTPSENVTSLAFSALTGETETIKIFAIGISSLNEITQDEPTINTAMRASMWNSIQRASYGTSNKTTTAYPSATTAAFSFGSYYLKAGITYKYLLAQ